MGPGTYPSIFGAHNRTIVPSRNWADFIVPSDVYSGDYVFFAAAFDMETWCCGCDAEPYSVKPWWWIATTSKEESWANWLEIVED